MSDEWFFGGVAFTWLRQTVNGHPAAPRWNRRPRLVERPLLDSGEADVSRVGFTPRKISGQIYVEGASVAALEALNGEAALLSDGVTSWTAILELDAATLVPDGAGVSGPATFTRPRA